MIDDSVMHTLAAPPVASDAPPTTTTTTLSSGEAKQREIEDQSLHAGVAAYRERVARHAANGTEGHTDYGKRLVATSVPPLVAAIGQFIEDAKRKPGWRVNAAVLDAVRQVWEAGWAVGGMPSRHDEPLPAKPGNCDADPEAKASWKRRAAETFRANQKAQAKRLLAARVVYLAERFAKFPAVWFPAQLDFRGRVYLMPQYLNPQGSDLAKGLLTFAEGKPLGERGAFWLGVHLANTFGYDKCSLRERHDWAVRHADRVRRTASDPLADRWWTEADKPFQFLAASIEWAGYLDQGDGYVCSLPIMVDGSCNGLQHFSAMLRDQVCGRQVNLVPQDRPADIYAAVAEALKGKLAVEQTGTGDKARWASLWLAYGIDRTLCKRPVMVLPYGGTRRSFQEHLLEAVREREAATFRPNPFGPELLKATHFLTTLLIQVMDVEVVGPRKVMNWFQAVAKRVSKTNEAIQWVTPTGFPVRQKYMNKESRRIKTRVGEQTMTVSISADTDKLDKRKQAQAIAPNFVHSMDASALVLTICDAKAAGLSQFAAVHDSYGTVAADMQTMMDCLRASFVRMYEENDVLEQFRVGVGSPDGQGQDRDRDQDKDRGEDQDQDLPPTPDKGTLDLRGVLKSEFFFA